LRSGGNLIAAAFALTALSYGLARFAYGLLLPQIRNDLSFGAAAAGWIGGGAFAAYCLGIVFASLWSAKLGERAMAMLAGLTATAGVGLVALAPSAPVLGGAIALSGLSTGFASPPLASAVARGFEEHARPRANGMINSGTAAGIVFSGIAAAGFAADWRELYTLFALIGVAVTAWLWFALPQGKPARQDTGIPLRQLARPGLAGLCAAAFLMGASSTAIWTFGADVLRGKLGFPETRLAIAWVTLGLGGLAGASTGILVARFGIGLVHRLALLAMALCYGMLMAATVAPLLAFAAMAWFGAAYIVSSGVLLIRGTALLAERPDLGLGVPFLAVAVGQMFGAPLFGAVLDGVNAWVALMLSAAMACGAMCWGMKEAAVPRRE
jgi:predicted MFS family arabinose efflux permease